MSLPRHYFGESMAEAINDTINEWSYLFPRNSSYTFRGRLVDTDKFDIVPKKEYLDKEIAAKEEELKQVEIRHRQHEDRIREEIAALKDQRDRRKRDKP